MDDLDAALAQSPPRLETARSVRSDHSDHLRGVAAKNQTFVPADTERSRAGKSACRNGKRAERELATLYGGRRVGHFGGITDVETDLFNIQSKRVNPGAPVSGKRPARFPEWIWDELAKLPRTGGRIPTLIVTDKPGYGGRRRGLVVRFLEDDVALHGETP